MPQTVTLEIPDDVLQRARKIAQTTDRRVEDVLTAWLDRASEDLPVESLPDREVLALCDLQLDVTHQEELNELLDRNREDLLDSEEQQRLDDLMEIYDRSLLRKAEALSVAVKRGLRPRLS